MTRRDYEALSAALKAASNVADMFPAGLERQAFVTGWEAAAISVAGVLGLGSSAFDQKRFLKDAGVRL